MRITIDDVAAQAGVSKATVSRAFSHPDKVSASTRSKVLSTAERLNFSISRSPKVLKSGRSWRVALLVGSSAIEWFTARIIEGLNAVFRDAGYDLVIYPIGQADDRTAFFNDLPVRGNTDAVIISSFDISQHEIDRLGTAHVPIIGINITTTERFDASIRIDDTAGIKMIVRHLARLGHRNIVLMHRTFGSNLRFSSYNRIIGFQEVCAATEGMRSHVIPVPHDDDIFEATVSELLAQDNAPTAICFHDDTMAIPLFIRLQRCGILVPEDISIAGFDDATYSAEVGLTTVRQRPRDMAITIARKTLDLIEGRPVDIPHETAPLQLLIRSSTAAPRTTSHF